MTIQVVKKYDGGLPADFPPRYDCTCINSPFQSENLRCDTRRAMTCLASGFTKYSRMDLIDKRIL